MALKWRPGPRWITARISRCRCSTLRPQFHPENRRSDDVGRELCRNHAPNPCLPELVRIVRVLAQKDVPARVSCLEHPDVPEDGFIQHHHPINCRDRSVHDVSSMFSIFLQQAPEVFRIGLIFERYLNIP